jgi:hypothetical protein
VKLRALIAATLLSSVGGLAATSDPPVTELIVHEWGTFLAMAGSDGVVLDGMYHEEHALPPFVHARSRDQLRLRQSNMKGETPVIYFYATRPMRAYVHVGFPDGLWTQWYPQASMVGPGLTQAGSPPQLRNGRIDWNVEIVPSGAQITLPATTADALWNHARDVDAAYVSTFDEGRAGRRREWERFIFYRGLGEARLPLDARVSAHGVVASTAEPAGLQHLFIARVEHGRGAYAYLPSLRPNQPLEVGLPDMATAAPLAEFSTRIADDMVQRLVASGLYPKEARAMVNTWKSSYFQSDGIRVLFVLPQSWTDRFIPLRIDPRPAQLVRVMVGRVELLDAAREQRAEAAIRDLASADSATREQAFAALRGEGRYVEPIVKRVLHAATDARVRSLARRLLLTDFVTELRTALTDAETGERVTTDAAFVRAQLASVLREAGLDAEARQEGRAALAQLQRMPPPQASRHESRHLFRALARASEAAGDEASALKWYGEFVRFGAQQCEGCHDVAGPRDLSFFRDWYAGRKFAEYAMRTGEAPRLIAAHEATRAGRSSDLATQLSLAYLYDAIGESHKAHEIWRQLAP